jgi:hypothetical protein
MMRNKVHYSQLRPYAAAVVELLRDPVLEWEIRENAVHCAALNFAIKFNEDDVWVWTSIPPTYGVEAQAKPFNAKERKTVYTEAWDAAARTLLKRRDQYIANSVGKKLAWDEAEQVVSQAQKNSQLARKISGSLSSGSVIPMVNAQYPNP